jgi:hypothetical protein
MQRSFLTIAATALLAACAHAGSSTLPAANAAHGADAAQKAPQSAAYPLRAAAGAVRRTHSAAASPKCGTVVTQAFGTLTYAVRGTSIQHTTVDATGCDVGVFIGAGDGENDSGAVVDHVDVRNAAFAGVLVTDGADNVSIDHTTIAATGGDPSGVSAALAIDGATHVRVAHTDVSAYQTYGFLAEAGASFGFDHVTAAGPGAVTTGAQAGFAVAGATQLGNSHPKSSGNQGTGSTPAFLVPGGGGGAQSWAYFYCGATDAAGNALTSVGDQPKSSNNTNDTMLAATCTGTAVPTPTPTPSPTPTPTPTPSPTPAAASKLFVGNSQNATIAVYDLDGLNGFAPPGATFTDPNAVFHGQMAVANGLIYATDPTVHTISVIDPNTNTVVNTITAGVPNAQSIAYGGGKLYLDNGAASPNGKIFVFDTTNNGAQPATITDPSLNGSLGMAYGNGRLYVNNNVGRFPGGPAIADNISVFDTSTGALITTIPDPGIVPNGGLYGATFGGGLLYVSNIANNTIYALDPANGYAVVGTIPNEGAYVLTWAAGKLYVANYGYQQIDIFDTTNNNALVTSINHAAFPYGLAVI